MSAEPKIDARHWVTKDKRRVAVVDMEDQHLANTIRMLRRKADNLRNLMLADGFRMLSFLRGEYALLAVEQDLTRLELIDNDDILKEHFPCYEAMLKEAGRRRLELNPQAAQSRQTADDYSHEDWPG